MNINNGKTGTVNIPGALHSTGGDGDGQVGNVVAYAGDIWDDIIGKNQREINATISARTNSLQEIVTELQSSSGGGITSWEQIENFEDTPYIFDGYDITEIALEKSGLHTDDNGNFISFVQNGHNDSYTPNGVTETSDSTLIGRGNSLSNTYNGVLLGNGNTTDGKKNSDNYDSTVIIGKSNNNSSNNSLLIGDLNNNNQNKSVLIGSSNINKSTHGINIGYYNQNNGGESSILIGDDNLTSNSANTICIGSANRITKFSNDLVNQNILCYGKGLYASTGGIFLGYYNTDDYLLTGDTANYLTIGNGSDSYHRSNIIEQRRNGDIYIKGIGNYDGSNSRYSSDNPYRGKSLQEVLNQLNTDIQSVSENTGGGSSGSLTVTSDADWVNEVLPGAILVSGVTITAKWITDTNRGNWKYLGFEADQEVNWDMINIDVYDYETEQRYNRHPQDNTRICNNCLMTEISMMQFLNGDENAISEVNITIYANPSFGYSYTIDYDDNIANQFEDDGWWWIENNGDNIEY